MKRMYIWITLALLVSGMIGSTKLQAQTLVMNPPDGHYCAGSGNGVAIGIYNSAIGQLYTLRKLPAGSIVSTVTGTGTLVYFGGGTPLKFPAGTYYVTPPPPSNQVTVENPTPVPVLESDPADGHYCTNATPPGVTLKVANPVSGASYQLYKDGTPEGGAVTGGSNPITMGTSLLAGTYFVVVTHGSATCTSDNFTVVGDTPPTAGFTYPPNSATICASTPITFTDNSTDGSGVLTTWLWNFDDGNTSGDHPTASHVFEAIGCGEPSRDYNVSLTVTDLNGCTANVVHPIKVMTKPDATLTATPDNSSDPLVFSSCEAMISNPTGSFTFSNGSTTPGCITNYNIDFNANGNGTASPSTYNGTTFTSQLVNYTGLGDHTVTFTVNNATANCPNTKTYTAYIGNMAEGNIDITAFQRYGVAPWTVDLLFSSASGSNCYNNTPGTKYNIKYGDGLVEIIDQANLPLMGSPYQYTYTTCSFPSPPLHCSSSQYAYKLEYSIKNHCSEIEGQICPIIVNCPTTGGFCVAGCPGSIGSGGIGWSPGDTDPNHLYSCNPVSFTNSTTAGVYIYPGGASYSTTLNYLWDFGSNATPSTSTDPTPSVTFSPANATYTIELITWTGPAGTPNNTADTITKLIYIQSSPTANFTTDYPASPDICVPYTVQVTNLSDEGGTLGGRTYLWKVKRDGYYVSSGFNIVTPGHIGDDTYPEPWFQFNVSGTWEIEMTLTNSCGSSVKLSDSMIICQPPAVSFSTPDISFCGPSYVVQVCPSYNENCSSGSVTYTWQTPLPGGASFVPPDNASTPCPHISFPAVGDYSLTVTIENICDQATATQVVHITDPITNNILDPNGLITSTTFCGCINTPMTIEGSTPVGGAPSYIYQWQSAASQVGPWTNIVIGGLAKDYIIPAPMCQTICYRRLVYDQGYCESISAPICFNMVPVIQNNLIASSQSLCAGQIPSILMGSNPTGGDGTFLFNWEMESPPASGNWVVVGTQKDYQPGPVFSTTTYRRRVVSGPCEDISSAIVIAACDPISNNDIKVTVGVTDYTTYEICSGTQPPQITGSAPAGACNLFTYQWQQSVTSPFTVFADITTGGTGQHYTPPALTQTTHYRRIVKPDPITGCVDNISNVMVIIVNPNPTASGIASPGTITPGANTDLFGSATGGTPFTTPPAYQYCWEPAEKIAGSNCLQNVTTIPLLSSQIFTLTVNDSKGCTGTTSVPVTVGAGVTCNEITSSNYAIPIHVCPGCPNGQVSLSISATGGTGNYSYNWYAGGILIGTNSTIQVCPSVTTTYSCTVTDGLSSCTKSIVVTVDPIPVITNSNSTLSICSCSPVNFTPISSVPGITYTWTATSPIGGTPVTSTGGTIINDVLCNFVTSVITYTYTITPTGPAPTYCVGIPFMLTVNVAPVASVTTSPNSQVVVPGPPTQTTPVTLTSDVGQAQFSWSAGTVFPSPCVISSSHPSGTGNLPVMTFTLNPSNPSTCNLPYTVIPSYSFTGGPTCPGNNYTYTYIFNAQPTVFTLQCPPVTNVCEGTSVTLTLNGSEPGVSYQLMNGASAVSSPITGTNSPLTWIVSVSGSYSVIATNSSNGQSVNMNGMCTLTIAPWPATSYLVYSTGNCPGDWILQNNSQAGVAYELYRNGISTGVVRNGPGPLDFGPQNIQGTYTVKATTIGSACSVWVNGSATINPLVIPANAGQIYGTSHVCKGAQNISYAIDPLAGATSYIWVVPAGASLVSGTGTNQVLVSFTTGFSGGIILVLGSNACAQGQHSSLWIAGHTLSGSLTLTDDTVMAGDSLCYAYDEIMVGDLEDPYLIQTGGMVDLQAMSVIRLLPGTIVQTGGKMNATAFTCLPCSEKKIAEVYDPAPVGSVIHEIKVIVDHQQRMNLFPNPSYGKLNIQLFGVPEGEVVWLEIYDMFGRRQHAETIQNEKINSVSVSVGASGVYSVRCKTTSSGVFTGKIVMRND